MYESYCISKNFPFIEGKLGLQKLFKSENYHKVASNTASWLEARFGFYRLLWMGKFDLHFREKVDFLISSTR